MPASLQGRNGLPQTSWHPEPVVSLTLHVIFTSAAPAFAAPATSLAPTRTYSSNRQSLLQSCHSSLSVAPSPYPRSRRTNIEVHVGFVYHSLLHALEFEPGGYAG